MLKAIHVDGLVRADESDESIHQEEGGGIQGTFRHLFLAHLEESLKGLHGLLRLGIPVASHTEIVVRHAKSL